MNKDNIKKVVLAYSGGLDTSIIIPWLKENYNNCEVIAVSGNVGQADELEGLEEKAIKTGASKLYVLDLTEEYAADYIMPCLKAGAVYEDYLLGTSHARPCIAKALAEIAHKEGAATLARVDEAHEVVEHLARAEKAVDAAGRAAGYHGGLVDDEERVPQFVEAQLKAGVLARKGLLAVDDAVYGVGRLPRVVCQHLGGTACGSQ